VGLAGGGPVGKRPASWSARRSTNSIWAFTLRSSSAAHFCRASCSVASTRRRYAFFSATANLGVEAARVHDRLRVLLAAENDEQIAHHRRLPLLVEHDHAALRQLLERHLDHADRAFDDAGARRDHRARLLATEHRLRDLRRVREVRQARLDRFDAGLRETVL